MFNRNFSRQLRLLRFCVILTAPFTLPTFAVDKFVVIPTVGEATATAVSADGLTVVGETEGQAFRWSEANGIELLGFGPDGTASTARSVSADGSVVVGSFTDEAGQQQPFRWTATDGLVSIRPAIDGAAGIATDVSDDGSIVVGEFGIPATGTNCTAFRQCTLVDSGSVRAFSWTETEGMSFLEFAAGATTPEGSSAVSISGDGEIITGLQYELGDTCGFVDGDFSDTVTCIAVANTLFEVFQATSAETTLLSLTTTGLVTAVSADGSTIVGLTRLTQGAPFRWRADGGLQELDFDPLLLEDIGGQASAVSANGEVVGGQFGLWTNDTTVETSNLLINGYNLRPHGLWLQAKPPNVTNAGITGLSDDGQTIVGIGIVNSTAVGAARLRRAYFARIDSTPLTETVAALPPYIPDTFGFLTGPLLSAALPLARSTQINETVTAFVTLINRTQQPMQGCSIGVNTELPVTFSYAPTDPVDNSVTGPANELFALAAEEVKSFVVGMTPTGEFASTRLDTVYECGNALRGTLFPELNELVLASSITPVPDILAQSATTTNDGIAALDGNNQAAFSVATFNLGAATSSIRVEAFPTGGLAAFTTSICETAPLTGECLGAPEPSLTVSYAPEQERTFGVFVTSSQPIEPRFETRRVRVQFTDDIEELRGSTSVAVVTLQ